MRKGAVEVYSLEQRAFRYFWSSSCYSTRDWQVSSYAAVARRHELKLPAKDSSKENTETQLLMTREPFLTVSL